MRTMLLSLKPEVFKNVQSGVKIYEHRRVFPDEPVKAYIYVSRPVQALAGVMYLGNKTNIEDWKEKYRDDAEAQERINEYLKHHKVVMEIQKFQNTSSISLQNIKKVFSSSSMTRMMHRTKGASVGRFGLCRSSRLGEETLSAISRRRSISSMSELIRWSRRYACLRYSFDVIILPPVISVTASRRRVR